MVWVFIKNVSHIASLDWRRTAVRGTAVRTTWQVTGRRFQMRIDDELTSFLDERIREHSSTDKDRNIEIIRYYYGFGEAERPTYREVARKFPGIVTRERVRQIIDQFFSSAREGHRPAFDGRFSRIAREPKLLAPGRT